MEGKRKKKINERKRSVLKMYINSRDAPSREKLLVISRVNIIITDLSNGNELRRTTDKRRPKKKINNNKK